MPATNTSFPDPSRHPDWIPPHSEEWYARLSSEYDKYEYPWKSQFDEPTATTIYKERIQSYLTSDSRVLDVGCGHGEFVMQFASCAKEVIGIDIRERFIDTANRLNTAQNAEFSVVNVDDGLSFPDDYFDVVLTKKGPWLFREGNHEGVRVMKPGGIAAGIFHGYTDGGLRTLFPGLYSPSSSKDPMTEGVREVAKELQSSHMTDLHVQGIAEVEYLLTPEDVLVKKCFGQSETLKEYVWRECLRDVESIFYKNATSKGLRVINYYYIVTARAR